MASVILSLFCIAAVIVVTSAADVSQEIRPFPTHFEPRNRIQKLTEIPKQFEVKNNAQATFDRYIGDIENLAKAHNFKIKYNVKVTINKKRAHDKKKGKLIESAKKYNKVSLKKQNSGLSPFEKMLRKIEEEKITDQKENEPHSYSPVTLNNRYIMTTRQPFSGKYKPIVSKLRSNFTKRVKPVRSKVITI